MSRYADLPPFHPGETFKVVRVVTLNGTEYQPNEILNKDGVSDRLLRRLYEQRKIVVVASGAPVTPKKDKSASKAAPAKEAAPVATEKDDKRTRYWVKQAGIGGHKVISPKGEVLQSYKDRDEALAEAERLNVQFAL